jgi:uncharacterized protein with von Willebrand factor type A (vWA) domain
MSKDNGMKPRNSRPSTAPSGHVYGIHDEQTSVVDRLGLDPDTLANVSDSIGGLDRHDGIAVTIHRKETVGATSGFVDEINDTVRGICYCKEVPTVEEVGAGVLFNQFPR